MREYEKRFSKTLDEDVKIGFILALAPHHVQNHCHLNSRKGGKGKNGKGDKKGKGKANGKSNAKAEYFAGLSPMERLGPHEEGLLVEREC